MSLVLFLGRPSHLIKVSVIMLATFADNTVILSTLTQYPTSVESLQHSLNTFHWWASCWKIKMNGAKLTNVVLEFRPCPHQPVVFNLAVFFSNLY